MEHNSKKSYLSWLMGLVGINIIVFVHELGHFLAAHLFSVPTPTFSIGFGPALIKLPLGDTIFQLSLLPLGGYVEINQEILAQQPYLYKMIVILAGIIFNIIFSVIIASYYRQSAAQESSPAQTCLEYIRANSKKSGIIGPIGLIHMIGQSFLINKHIFWVMLSIISLNIALFNLLPLPFFDGGQALLFTLSALGTVIPSNFITLISFLIFFVFILLLSIKDVIKLK